MKQFATIILLFLFYFFGVFSSAMNFATHIFSPVLRYFYAAGVSKGDSQEIDALKQEKNKLIEENSKLKMLETENDALREMLSFVKKNNFNYIVSDIIARGEPFVSGASYLIVDKGANDGVKLGSGVIDSSGNLVGKITELGQKTSKVCLVSSNMCQFAAFIPGNSLTTAGITNGNFELTIKLELIPQNIKINTGDIVSTSGLEENIPAGLNIGRVVQVFQENNNIWQSAVLEPLINYSDLKFVSIVAP